MNRSYHSSLGIALAAIISTTCSGPLAAAPESGAPAKGPAKAPAAPAASTVPAVPVPADGVAAEVNGTKIMMAEVNRFMDRIKLKNPTLNNGSDSAKAALTSLQDRILENLITHQLLFQEAHRLKLDPPKANVDKAVLELKGQFKSDDELTANLAKEGLTLAEVREQMNELMAIDELGKQWTLDIVVPDDEIAKFYKDNIKEFEVPEQVHARHILLKVKKDASPAERAKVKTKAQNLLKQAQVKGADFAKLAKANSEDEGSKPMGGDLGAFPRGMMVPSFETAAFSTPVGKVTDHLVESEFGYHIIKVEEKVPQHNMPLTEVKENLKTYLMKSKADKRISERIVGLREQAKIKKNI